MRLESTVLAHEEVKKVSKKNVYQETKHDFVGKEIVIPEQVIKINKANLCTEGSLQGNLYFEGENGGNRMTHIFYIKCNGRKIKVQTRLSDNINNENVS